MDYEQLMKMKGSEMQEQCIMKGKNRVPRKTFQIP